MENNAIIQINNLTKIYKNGTSEIKALDGIDLTIHRGDIFGIIGMSGAGKSTLVRCMNLLERPTSGEVLFNEMNLAALNDRKLRMVRQKIGMIFQQFNLLMQRTVEKNILFPMEIAGMDRETAKKRVDELLEIVDLTDKKNTYPAQLSGGQKQRVAIARALATNPEVLLCDEATSALDPKTTRAILSLLRDINHRLGITIIIITHEMSVIEEICSHVAIIDESKIAETGTVQDIFSHPKTVSAQRLVHPTNQCVDFGSEKGGKHLRIVFNGNSSFEPVIGTMVMSCKCPVNIMFADTKNIDGKAFGQMVIQLPDDEAAADKMIQFLSTQNVSVEEVQDFV
ncbi:methionine ABC transporter ATP-binding protein [Sinanaerobacter sp. ZZT-01]|uniref:methionine ABC transporter ATP-binding protein n=1 Tax=Sinanaerobacter sp. ZZT-01 TaxID=3111540 RepID=UPI002D799FFA|nr:ATP-binding cassette domain-containing protein [Sinanaerobacter sp. ZZT-01]WRR92906.1 ATP-binding cassette domain-containing protein [Sinanaerobacter sp. ZZT-01]